MSLLARFDGWVHGLYMACIAFPLYNVGAKFAIENYNANPLVFLCFGSLFSSFFLLVYAGRGNLALSSLKTMDTWIFAFLNLAAVSFGISLLAYVSALQGSVLIRFASIVCFVLALIMGQSSNKKEYVFTLMSFMGIAVMFMNLELTTEQRAISLLLLLGASACQALRQLLSEFHKTNILANNKKDNARVAGVVSSISALTFTVILLFVSLYQDLFSVEIFESMPKLDDFFNLGCILTASVFAGVFSAIAKYCEFYASKKISAKYLASMLALMPMFVLFYDSILFVLMGEPMPFSRIDIVCMLMIVTGNLGISISAIISSKKQDETELRSKYITISQENVNYCIELAESTMSFAHNDLAKVSKLLGVEQSIIIDLLALNEGEEYSLSEFKFHEINKNYYLNVSSKDALTGLLNRGRLEQKLKDLVYNEDKFSLVFIDLNKFKQINDTFGHEAGDEVLKHTAQAMKKANPNGINARNGGDEFIMITFSQVDEVINQFKQNLEELLLYNEMSIKVSASVGHSFSDGKEADLDSLIKQADLNMYQEKEKTK